jgi:hypothetical protein
MRWVPVLVVAACSYKPAGFGADDAGNDVPASEAGLDAGDDAAVDAPGPGIDAPPAAACFGVVVQICLPSLPGGNVQINSQVTRTIDTDSTSDCLPLAAGTTVDACVLAGRGVQIDGTLVATGSRPLVLLATVQQININGNGTVDVSSKQGSTARGAGARASCAGGSAASGGGGGAGGSHGGAGGAGGSAAVGTPGTAAGPSDLVVLVGGCPGRDGGNSSGSGGRGGGAVALISVGEIIVDGRINASGAGGDGGEQSATARGGGGGGSGGLIVFDTSNLTINGNGRLLAQGGGGGEGNSATASGDDGDDPTIPGTAASGGSTGGVSSGGDGGPGGTAAGGSAGEGALGTNGAGGGGGGAGYIARRAGGQLNQNTTAISPPLTVTN